MDVQTLMDLLAEEDPKTSLRDILCKPSVRVTLVFGAITKQSSLRLSPES